MKSVSMIAFFPIILMSLVFNIFDWYHAADIRISVSEQHNQCSSDAEIGSLAVSSDNKYVLAVWNYNTVKLWDRQTGVMLRTFSQISTSEHQKAIFSPDNKRILISMENNATLWDISTGDKLQTFSPELGEFNSTQIYIDFSPDGKYVFTGGSKGAAMWEADTGKKIRVFPGDMENDEYQHVQLSSNGRYLLTNDNTWYVWDTQTGEKLYSFPTAIDQSNPTTLANKAGTASFSPDGKLVLINNADGFFVWITDAEHRIYKRWGILDTRKAERLWRISPDSHYVAAFVDDSDLLENITLWSLLSSKELYATNITNLFEPYIFSPDSRYFLTLSETQLVPDELSFQAVLWDITSKAVSIIVDMFKKLFNPHAATI